MYASFPSSESINHCLVTVVSKSYFFGLQTCQNNSGAVRAERRRSIRLLKMSHIFLTGFLFQFCLQVNAKKTMRSSIVRWVQIIPRKVLQLPEKKITLPPAPQTRDLKAPTLVDVLMQQKEATGELWPRNI